MHFPWLTSMNVGVPLMDVEHQHLFDLLRELGTSVAQDNPSGARLLVDEYLSILEEHLVEEELVMDRCGYPDAESHKADHRHCLVLLRRIQWTIGSGSLDHAGGMLFEYTGHYFRDLLRHDNLLARYLREVAPDAGSHYA